MKSIAVFMSWKGLLLQLFIGAVVGLLVLHPFSMIVFWFQFEPQIDMSLWDWLFRGIDKEIRREVIFHADLAYMVFGAVVSVLIGGFYRSFLKKALTVRKLTTYLEDNLLALIEQGEGESLEFKSSLRWDYRQDKMNKELEKVILKSLAGYLNGKGGTLLIGIDDVGQILGLENDYSTFKKKNRDGFELCVMDLVSTRLAADICPHVILFFHTIEEKEVCRVIVEPANRAVYVKEGQTTHFFLRSGAGTRQLNVQEAVAYIKDRFS